MYLDHWGIARSPFGVDLDVAGFYASPAHEEAQARIEFLVSTRRRLGVLLGPTGIGKTLSLYVAAGQLRRTGKVAVLVDALGASVREVLWQLAGQLGTGPRDDDDAARLWRRIASRVKENRFQNIETVMLVDDAGHAGPDLVTQLVRLARLDPSPDSRWTMILTALQPQAARWNASLRELIDLRIDIEPWDESDTIGYVQSSLVDAGRLEPAFTDEAIALLHELSGGVPRQVARLADFALLAGAGAELELIDAETIRAAHAEITWTAAVLV
jgi:general secretion pathway protein A